MEREPAIHFEALLVEWLPEITVGSPSTPELGRRFTQKLFGPRPAMRQHKSRKANDDERSCDG